MKAIFLCLYLSLTIERSVKALIDSQEENTDSWFFTIGDEEPIIYNISAGKYITFDGKNIKLTDDRSKASHWRIKDDAITIESFDDNGNSKTKELTFKIRDLEYYLCPDSVLHGQYCYYMGDFAFPPLRRSDTYRSIYSSEYCIDGKTQGEYMLCSAYLQNLMVSITITTDANKCTENQKAAIKKSCNNSNENYEVINGQGGISDIQIEKDDGNVLQNLNLVAVISSQNERVMIKDRTSLKCLYIDNEQRIKLGNMHQCQVWEIVDNQINIKTNNEEIQFAIWPPTLFGKITSSYTTNNGNLKIHFSGEEMTRFGKESMKIKKTTRYKDYTEKSDMIDIQQETEIYSSDRDIRYIKLSYVDERSMSNTFDAFVHLTPPAYGECFPGWAYKGNKCTLCEQGRYIFQNKVCIECKNIFVTLNNTCTPCGPTEITDVGQTECTRCEDGKVPNFEQTECRRCGNGEEPNKDETDCNICSFGFNSGDGLKCKFGVQIPMLVVAALVLVAAVLPLVLYIRKKLRPEPNADC